jgi:VanZ family protein
MRKICAGYWLLLTALLLAKDPWGWFDGGRRVDAVYEVVEPMAHLLSFTLLTMLVLATRWSISRGWLIAILAGYGIATELVQSQIPGRQMQLSDIIQDFVGILAGCAAYWAWQQLAVRSVAAPAPLEEVWQRPRRREPLVPESAGDSIA